MYVDPCCRSVNVEKVSVVVVGAEFKTAPVELIHCTRLVDPEVSAQFKLTESPIEYIPK